MTRNRNLMLALAAILLTIFLLGCDSDDPVESLCGNNTCDAGENSENCPNDCKSGETGSTLATASLSCDELPDFNVSCSATFNPRGSSNGGQWTVTKAGSFVVGQSGQSVFDFYVGEEDPPCGSYRVALVPTWNAGFTGSNPQTETVTFPADEFCPVEFPPLAVAFMCTDVGGGTIDCKNNSTGVELPAHCTWSFGDGRSTEDCGFNGVRHTYEASLLPGIFDVRLALVDRELRDGSKTEEVSVAAP